MRGINARSVCCPEEETSTGFQYRVPLNRTAVSFKPNPLQNIPNATSSGPKRFKVESRCRQLALFPLLQSLALAFGLSIFALSTEPLEAQVNQFPGGGQVVDEFAGDDCARAKQVLLTNPRSIYRGQEKAVAQMGCAAAMSIAHIYGFKTEEEKKLDQELKDDEAKSQAAQAAFKARQAATQAAWAARQAANRATIKQQQAKESQQIQAHQNNPIQPPVNSSSRVQQPSSAGINVTGPSTPQGAGDATQPSSEVVAESNPHIDALKQVFGESPTTLIQQSEQTPVQPAPHQPDVLDEVLGGGASSGTKPRPSDALDEVLGNSEIGPISPPEANASHDPGIWTSKENVLNAASAGLNKEVQPPSDVYDVDIHQVYNSILAGNDSKIFRGNGAADSSVNQDGSPPKTGNVLDDRTRVDAVVISEDKTFFLVKETFTMQGDADQGLTQLSIIYKRSIPPVLVDKPDEDLFKWGPLHDIAWQTAGAHLPDLDLGAGKITTASSMAFPEPIAHSSTSGESMNAAYDNGVNTAPNLLNRDPVPNVANAQVYIGSKRVPDNWWVSPNYFPPPSTNSQ
jgi:hypothetical protein